MILDGKNIDDTARLCLLRECESEGSVSPAQADDISAEHIAEVERLCLVDLIKVMRNVRNESPRMDEITRERYAKRLETLSLEAAAACAFMRRYRADTSVPPEYLRDTGRM